MKIKDELGKLYEERYIVVEIKHEKSNYQFYLQNIYNHSIIRVPYKTMNRISNNEITISNVIHHRLKTGRRKCWYD